MIDYRDREILKILQENCRLSVKEIAGIVGSPITTVYSKIKKLEREGYLKRYTAVLDEGKLGFSTTAFILLSFSYEAGGKKLDQREVAREIAKIPEVQEVHIITGDWDMILKVKVRDVDELGRFIIDKLRKVEGVEKTLTSVSLETVKETTSIPLT
ncbi:MAG: Lrp/AsnC family transcriptional regulator [Candidatus Methanomethylicia archaeon]